MCQQARAGNLTIRYRKKEIDVSFPCVCPVIDNEFRHNIVKVVCGSTATSMINNRTHEKTEVNLIRFLPK